jgi:hypothetical protein
MKLGLLLAFLLLLTIPQPVSAQSFASLDPSVQALWEAYAHTTNSYTHLARQVASTCSLPDDDTVAELSAQLDDVATAGDALAVWFGDGANAYTSIMLRNNARRLNDRLLNELAVSLPATCQQRQQVVAN